jgi:DNA-binding NarL/FixJ family response regulator
VLFMAVRRVFDGQAFFCDRALARLRRERLAARGYSGNGPSLTASLAARLTPREATIAGYLAQGLSVRATAWALDLSPKTVDTHKTNLMTKLGVHDRIGLYRFALQEGLVAVSRS